MKKVLPVRKTEYPLSPNEERSTPISSILAESDPELWMVAPLDWSESPDETKDETVSIWAGAAAVFVETTVAVSVTIEDLTALLLDVSLNVVRGGAWTTEITGTTGAGGTTVVSTRGAASNLTDPTELPPVEDDKETELEEADEALEDELAADLNDPLLTGAVFPAPKTETEAPS